MLSISNIHPWVYALIEKNLLSLRFIFNKNFLLSQIKFANFKIYMYVALINV